MNSVESQAVHMFVVWLPTIRTDNREAAVERTGEFSDPRVSYYWDEILVTGRFWQKLLELPTIAWDVFFIYGPQSQWDESPGRPAFWMHQMQAVDSAPQFNRQIFLQKVMENLP